MTRAPPRDPDKIAAELIARGEQWADLDAAASALEETRKSVLAECAMNYRSDSKSFAEAETKALANATYREHIDRMVAARRAANRARVRYDTGKIWTELVRTSEATRRAEMSLR